MGKVTLRIYGMHGEHCIKRIKEVIDDVDGVTSSEVTIACARVVFDESKTGWYDLVEAISIIGYRVAER